MTTTKTQKMTAPAAQADPALDDGPKGKLGAILALLIQPNGATITAMQVATGWQAHSVRGAISGALKKKLGYTITSEKTEAGRVYRVAKAADA